MRGIPIEGATPVGVIARFVPGAIEIFESLDIDYACYGGRRLADAAAASGVDLDGVMAALIGCGSEWNEDLSLPDLIQQIITEHHRFDRELIRDLEKRLDRQTDPGLARIRRLLASLALSLRPHERREERELFPLVETLFLQPERIRSGSISHRLFEEFVEHGLIHDRLQKIREVSLGLRARGAGDAQLLDDLDRFERMAHRHIHLENNVLIPRVVERENELRTARRG